MKFLLNVLLVLGFAAAVAAPSLPAQQPSPAASPAQNSPVSAAAPDSRLTAPNETFSAEHMRVHVFRLRPGDDLLQSILAYARAHQIQAAIVLSGVGSLTEATIRYADQHGAVHSSGHFEIVSLTGTVEQDGAHLHLAISNEKGVTQGGHLVPGCKIYTTAEIALGELVGARFTRELDKQGSGWEELKIYPVGAPPEK